MNRKLKTFPFFAWISIYISYKTENTLFNSFNVSIAILLIYIFFSFIYIYVYIIINKRDPHKREIQEFLHEFGTLKVRIAKPLTPKTI
jgi:GT2 family glycosyltransferase